MATEVERKFLVSGTFPSGESSEIHQAYLSLDPERTVRVRIADDTATLTVKGKTEGISRQEFEFEIPLDDAHDLLELSVGHPIKKTRTRIPLDGRVWEVDVFHDANAGLVVAEVELDSEHEEVALPGWLGSEVSNEPRYLNACLAQCPYSDWSTNPSPTSEPPEAGT